MYYCFFYTLFTKNIPHHKKKFSSCAISAISEILKNKNHLQNLVNYDPLYLKLMKQNCKREVKQDKKILILFCTA